ncbi:hypothetical protein V8B97DRAFT_1923250 [Scleroderma yunnanense]
MDYYKRSEQAPPIQTTTSMGTSTAAPGPSTPAPASATSVTAPPLPHTAASTGPIGTVPVATPTTTTVTLPVSVGGSQITKKGDGQRDYKYAQEISQMMFVFGEIQDPIHETVNLVEDIVRGQLIELVRFSYPLSSDHAYTVTRSFKPVPLRHGVAYDS